MTGAVVLPKIETHKNLRNLVLKSVDFIAFWLVEDNTSASVLRTSK